MQHGVIMSLASDDVGKNIREKEGEHLPNMVKRFKRRILFNFPKKKKQERLRRSFSYTFSRKDQI